MTTDSRYFYEQLPGFSEFAELSNSHWYQPLPDDWCVVVTDVQGSTRAIEEGRYKQVNGVGVASIVALLNALKPLRVPYVFGGDGATACFPCAFLDRVKPALVASRNMSIQEFQLHLRIGVVAMSEIRQQGYQVLVGKHQPHSHYQQAMFLGDGLGYAEKLVKHQAPDNPYLIREQAGADNSIFEGFECRWNEIPSPHEENIALLVQSLAQQAETRDHLYAQLLQQVKQIYGDESQYHPLREQHLTLTSSPRLLSIEAGIRTAFQSAAQRLKYLFKLQLLRLLGNWFMKNKIHTRTSNWAEYRRSLILNTDYRKFDEMLRMVISGSASQHQRLRAILDEYRQQGLIVYGIHASPAALITCIVSNYDRDHVHFLDGANGGYAMAAREMKQQLRDRS